MQCRCKGCEPWHFELRGWRQIVAFDALALFCVVLAYLAGYSVGTLAR